jgi:hypothetical protein
MTLEQTDEDLTWEFVALVPDRFPQSGQGARRSGTGTNPPISETLTERGCWKVTRPTVLTALATPNKSGYLEDGGYTTS